MKCYPTNNPKFRPKTQYLKKIDTFATQTKRYGKEFSDSGIACKGKDN